MYINLVIRPRSLPVEENDLNSLDFVVSRFFMRLFQAGNMDLVKCCQSYFCFELPSVVHDRRARKFDLRYRNHSNLFCQMISSLWPLYVIGQAIIFLPCGFFLLILSFYLFPRLISAAADWMSTILLQMEWP